MRRHDISRRVAATDARDALAFARARVGTFGDASRRVRTRGDASRDDAFVRSVAA